MMRTTVLRTLFAVLLSLCSGVVGAFVALHLYNSHQISVGNNVVRTQRIEIIDSGGNVRATLGLNHDDVLLEMLSPDSKTLVSLGVLAKTKERLSLLESAGENRPFYPAPLLQFNDSSGRGSVVLTTGVDGNGSLRFDSSRSTGKVLLGYFSDGDLRGGPHDSGTWGLRVVGRDADGLKKYTGVGILNKDGIDGQYLIPHPVDSAIAH